MSLPGPGDFCHGCNRLLCRCLPEPDPEVLFERAYEAGYEACLADGYSERPMTEWVYRTGSRVTWDAEAKRLRHHMTPLRFAGLTWRTRHASAWAYARWFERQHGLDLEAYLAGYDDAGAGLPSEASDPEHHARCVAALVAGEPAPSPKRARCGSLEVAPYEAGPLEDDGLPF